MFKPSIPNQFSLLLAVLLAANYFGIMSDLDWAWQIRTGEQIVRDGQLRTTEAFSYTIHGELVHDFEWIYEVTLWAAWSTLGMGGLKFLKMTLVALPFLLLGLRLRREGVRWHGIVLAFFIGMWVTSGCWNLRALYCTTIGLLLVSGWLHDHCLGRRPLTWWLPVVMLLWSNLHPGVITGQGLLAGAIGWEWLNRWLKLNPPLDGRQLRRLTLIGGLGFLATFISPDPIDRLLYPFRPELSHPIQQYFVEMKPLHSFVFSLPYMTLPIYALAALALLTIVFKFRKYRGWELALLAGLTLLANAHVRVLPDWVMIMLALCVPKMRDMVVDLAHAHRRRFAVRWMLKGDRFFRRLLNSWWFRFQPFWPAAVAACLLILTLIPSVANQLPVQAKEFWPRAAVAYAEEHALKGRFFATPDHGAYIGWRLKENGLVYSDTRGFFFPPEILADSIHIPAKGDDWRNRLERVFAKGTDYFLLDVAGERGALWRDLQPVIGDPLFVDEQCVLLTADQVRRGLAKLDQQIALESWTNP